MLSELFGRRGDDSVGGVSSRSVFGRTQHCRAISTKEPVVIQRRTTHARSRR